MYLTHLQLQHLTRDRLEEGSSYKTKCNSIVQICTKMCTKMCTKSKTHAVKSVVKVHLFGHVSVGYNKVVLYRYIVRAD